MKRVLKLIGLGFVIAWVAAAVGAIMVKRNAVPFGDEESDDVGLVSIFAPLEFESRAAALRSISLECWFGGGVLDLRGATLDDGLARMHVRLVFGGGQLIVPATWRVTNEVKGLGGVGDGRDGVDDLPPDAPELVLDGVVMFGGLGVSSEPNG